MKRLLILLTLFSAVAVYAQSTKAPATNAVPARQSESLQAQTIGRVQTTLTLTQPKPNEVRNGKMVFSGIGVEAVKKRNPLQLLNPLAPAEYGSPEDNVVRDPINRRVTGLKLFAIRF